MISDNSTVPEASTSASFVAGYYRICAGDSIDLFALNPGAGSIINWDLDGGASPSTYSGLNFQSLNNIAFAVPDTYYIQLTYEEDCCGLTNTDTLTLIVEDQPNLSISGVTDFCAGTGGSVLTASGGTGYTWTPALGLSSTNTSSTLANPSSSTTYFVTTSNASGTCFDTRSIPVTVNDVQLAISSTDAGCLPNGSANVTASGGNGNYTYRWETSPVQTGNIATGLGPGTYKILVEDQGGCLDSSYVTINQSPGTLSTLISTTQPASCNGAGDGTATVTLSGGTGPYFYSWSPGIAGSGSTSNPVPAGTYSVTVTDLSDGCQSTATAIITEPAPLNVELLSLSTPDCDTYGEALVNASGGNGPFAYSWNTNPPQTGARGVGLGTGTYNVTVTDRDNCNTIFPVTVTGSQDPVSIDSVSVSDPITCGDSTGSAQAFVSGSNGGIAYTWNTVPPTNGALLNNVPAGPYELIATGLNGCADTAGITIGPLCPLVLQPLLLRASPENEIIHLRWDYEFSEDGSGFEVSKSEDGVGFEMLGWIAKEEGENNGFYFDDKEVILGERYFYRLKHIRPDGNFVYSNIEEVLLTAEGQNLLKHHRYNTDQGALELILNPHQFFGLDVALFNTAGQMLIKKYFDISDGIRNLYINLEGVSKGVYFLQLNNNEGFHQEIKIIIQN
ncbi:MAG: T9SS type A sorting domain-containing protein [Bacteroidia bacterium]|nr:T9SS type A sorting domain-containing protein [Bacteroidia bacterium]